jgi:predicted methyltransferase
MRSLITIGLAAALGLASPMLGSPAIAQDVTGAIANPARADANRERDEGRNPSEVLAFMEISPGDTILDVGSGGGYYAELFSPLVGPDGVVYAHNRGGADDPRWPALTEHYASFGNIQLTPIEAGAPFPIETDSVDVIMLSYIYHHLHFTEESAEEFPPSTAAAMAEFLRMLRPGGTFVVIEHAATPGATRAQSAAWHRTPPEMARTDITGAGFVFAGEARGIYFNPYDDLANTWFDVGLAGRTTSFVHKYRAPE